MKKILKALLVVLVAIALLKFFTSSFFLWMVVAVVVPQGLKYLGTNGIMPEFRLRNNAYRYTAIAVIVFTVLRMLCRAHWAVYLFSSLIGVALSYLMFEDFDKR